MLGSEFCPFSALSAAGMTSRILIVIGYHPAIKYWRNSQADDCLSRLPWESKKKASRRGFSPSPIARAQQEPTARGSLIEPHILHAPAVIDAVGRDRQPLDIGIVAVAGGRVEDHRARAVL